MAKTNIDKLVAQLNRSDPRPGWLNTSWPAACELWKLGEAGKQPLIDALDHENKNTRMSAAIALGWYGPEMGDEAARKLLRELFRRWEDSLDKYYQRHVARALRRLYPNIQWVLDDIRGALKSKERHMRIMAAASLFSFGLHQIPLQGELIKLLDDSDYDVREVALDTMEEVGVRDPAHVERLLATMDNESDVQTAGRVLGKSGKYAGGCVAEIIKKLSKAEGQENRTNLFHALARWKDFDPRMLEPVRDIPAGIRYEFQGYNYLAECGFGDADYYRAYAEKCLNKLADQKQTEDWKQAISSLLRMAKIEPAWGDQARECMQKALQSKRIGVRISAMQALRQDLAEGDGKVLLTGREPEILMNMFRAEENEEFRTAVARLCAELGKNVANLMPEIVRRVGDKNENVSVRSIEVLGDIGVVSGDVISAIEGVLNNPKTKPNVRWSAVCAIGDLGAEAMVMAPLLLEACGKGGASQDACHYRQRAVESLFAIGYKDPAGVPVIEKMLNDSWPHTRFPAAALMHRIDPAHEFGGRVLLAGLGSEEDSHRSVTMDALIVNPSIEPVPVDVLRDRLYDSQASQRKKALATLAALKISPNEWKSEIQFLNKYELDDEVLQGIQ